MGRYFKAVLVCATIVVTITAVIALYNSMLFPRGNASTATRFSSTQDISHLIARAWITPARVYAPASIRYHIVFENHSGSEIREIRFLDFQLPGFDKSGDCWNDNAPACPAEPQKPTRRPPYLLQPGDSVYLLADLKPSVTIGRYGVVAVFAWTEIPAAAPKDKLHQASSKVAPQAYTGSIALDPIDITTKPREFGAALLRTFQNLALPIVLLALGWYFQTTQASREHVRQVRQQNLDRFVGYVQKYYLPISRNILLLNGSMKTADDPTADPGRKTDARRQAFYYMLMLWFSARELRTKKGGWFLSSHSAEALVGNGWFIFRYHLLFALGENSLDSLAAIPALAKSKDVAGCEAACSSGRQKAMAEALQDQFFDWIDNKQPALVPFRSCLALLRVIRAVLRFEMDKPFEHWYGVSPHLEDYTSDLPNCPTVPNEYVDQWKDAVRDHLRDAGS